MYTCLSSYFQTLDMVYLGSNDFKVGIQPILSLTCATWQATLMT